MTQLARLLIVEGDHADTSGLARVLTEAGLGVDLAHDEGDAIRLAQELAYDVILVHNMSPGLSEVALCRALRSTNRWQPIVALLGDSDTSQRVRWLDAGADDCLSGPFAADEIMARMRALLRRRDHLTDGPKGSTA